MIELDFLLDRVVEISEAFMLYFILFFKGAKYCIVENHVRHYLLEVHVILKLELPIKDSRF